MTGLRIEGAVVRFGGLVALDGVTLHAPPGRVTGLIGPNGAGKTTLFNVGSGLVSPQGGRVLLDDVDVTRAGPDVRGRRGLGRSFQRLALFDSLTVGENVLMGFEARAAGRNVLRQVLSGRRGSSDARLAVDEALHRCGMEELRDRFAGDLSTGQRRLVDLARVLAGGFHVLLLDEPSSGLDPEETERFGDVVRSLAIEDGKAVLIVEHDMRLVLAVCEHLHVLDFGRSIASGQPDEVMATPEVRAAYLGSSSHGGASVEVESC